jgi:hypothetical protein
MSVAAQENVADTIRARQIGPGFVAEVTGVDLTKPIT